MKKRVICGIILGIALGIVGCGNSKQLKAENASLKAENESLKAESEVETEVETKPELIESDTTNPLFSIIEECRNGQRNLRIGRKEIGEAEFLNFYTEYGHYLKNLGNYLTKHANEFSDGKKFSDFGDYEDEFSDFYDWAGKLVYYNGDVNDDYQVVWEKLKNIVIRHIEVMDDIYTADKEEVASSCNELLEYITDESNAIQAILPENQEKEYSSSNPTTSGYSGSYDATLNYSGSSGVLVFISEDVMERYMTALANGRQGTIDELFSSEQIGYTEKDTKCNIVKKKSTKAQVKLLDGSFAGSTVWVIIESLHEK